MTRNRQGIEVYLVYVDEGRCDGCGECRVLCPADVFSVFHKAVAVQPENCLGCRTCEAVCRSGAIVVTEI